MGNKGEASLEIEVKFIVADLAQERERMIAAGGTVKNPRIYERNVVYDTPKGDLRATKRLLRLRRDESVRLTFKGEPKIKIETEAKVREEVEVYVDDFKRMETIIARLGYVPVVVYEKYRETIQIGTVEAVLDELPYGTFIELEGPEADIKQMASELSINWEDRVLTNYLGLLEKVKTAYGFEFSDLTFDNFEGKTIDWSAIL
ncbi:MAG: class IV adenylate cyclase [Chloroflexota bacterium]